MVCVLCESRLQQCSEFQRSNNFLLKVVLSLRERRAASTCVVIDKTGAASAYLSLRERATLSKTPENSIDNTRALIANNHHSTKWAVAVSRHGATFAVGRVKALGGLVWALSCSPWITFDLPSGVDLEARALPVFIAARIRLDERPSHPDT